MLKKIIFAVVLGSLYALSMLTFTQCAQIVAPVGGKKDTIPPEIVEKYSTPNYQKNFNPKRIELTFNEWIKLDDANNQVVVSPPLAERPTVTLSGKKVIVEFAKTEILKTNATYTIQFGNAVKDLAESNIAPKLKFVFATGAELDSLIFLAKVIDVYTQLPIENALVMLYTDLTDSIVRKQKPYYFARTDKSGYATIENVRSGNYRVFALVEKDNNYLFSAEGEKIAFQDSLVRVNGRDTARENALTLKLFEPEKKLILQSKETDAYGLVRLGFTKPPRNVRIFADKIFDAHSITEIVRDSVLFWYETETDLAIVSPLIITQKADSIVSDTVKFKVKGRTDFYKKQKLVCTTPNALNYAPKKPMVVAFNFPLLKTDTSLMVLKDSSGKKIRFAAAIDSAHPRNFNIESKLLEGKYNLLILPKALAALHGFQNDSLKFSIFSPSEKEFGEYDLIISGLDSLKHYQFGLSVGEAPPVFEFSINGLKMATKNISNLKPDTYTLRIIEDENKNQRWDTGDYYKHRQAEKIYTKILTPIRPDWKLEAEIDINDL